MKRTIGIFLVLVAFLSACAAPRPRLDFNNPLSVASQITTKRDDFKKQTEFKGPNCAPSGSYDLVFLRAWKLDNSSETIFQIYVMDYYLYGEWRFYNSTWDSNGVQLDTTIISRNVESCSRSGCSHNEHLGINVTKEYLERAKQTGVRFKISGKAGEEIFSIPSAYIKAFLDATQ